MKFHKPKLAKAYTTAMMLGLSATLVPGEIVAAPVPIVTDSRIRTYVYNENEVFKLITEYGYQSSIEFGEEEQIHTISMGDVSGFKVQPSGNRLFIRALQTDKHTNMTVITTERVYQLELSSAVESDSDIIYVMRFYYPEEDFDPATGQPVASPGFNSPNVTTPAPPLPANLGSANMNQSPNRLGSQPNQSFMPPPRPRPNMPPNSVQAPMSLPAMNPPQLNAMPRPVNREQMPSMPQQGAMDDSNIQENLGNIMPQAGKPDPQPEASIQTSPGERNFNYTLEGPESLSPWQVYDDGQRTYIKFSQDMTLPDTLQVIDLQEEEREIIPASESDYVILPGVFKQIQLGNDEGTLIIYNEAKQHVS